MISLVLWAMDAFTALAGYFICIFFIMSLEVYADGMHDRPAKFLVRIFSMAFAATMWVMDTLEHARTNQPASVIPGFAIGCLCLVWRCFVLVKEEHDFIVGHEMGGGGPVICGG
jgi:peptidoglycan/LPS O-acetylase OafA/YrhL